MKLYVTDYQSLDRKPTMAKMIAHNVPFLTITENYIGSCYWFIKKEYAPKEIKKRVGKLQSKTPKIMRQEQTAQQLLDHIKPLIDDPVFVPAKQGDNEPYLVMERAGGEYIGLNKYWHHYFVKVLGLTLRPQGKFEAMGIYKDQELIGAVMPAVISDIKDIA